MPCFDFQHEPTGEIITVLVHHTEPDEARHQQIQDGKVYKRVYSAPLAAVDMGTRHGDGTLADFNRITASKKGLKVGDSWEISAEMSERRKQLQGVDPVQEAYYAKHQQETGEKHPDVKQRESVERSNAKLKQWGIKISV